MDQKTNKEIKKQLEVVRETLLNLKLQEGIDPNEIRLLQQKLDKLISTKTLNDDKN